MPELPEVETIVQGLKSSDLIGKTILQVESFLPKMVVPQNLPQLLKGQTIQNISRRAKFIILQLTDYFLTIHLRMTGHLFLTDSRPLKKHEHICIILKNDPRVLIYHDIRKFGKFILTKDLKEFFKNIGPEPLDKTFTFEVFYKNLKSKKAKIKPLLLDQSFIAGLGNIYANEALFLAQIHPERLAFKISKKEALKLFTAILKVLQEGIKNKGTSLGHNALNFCDLENHFGQQQNFLKVHGRNKEKCPVCKNLIEKKQIAQRSAFFCSQCQS